MNTPESLSRSNNNPPGRIAVRFRLKKPKKRSSPEIDKMMAMAEKLTPDELEEFISSTFVRDLQFLKRLIMEQKEGFDQPRKLAPLQYPVKEVANLYEDLVTDGRVRKDLSLFKKQELMGYKLAQATDEAMSILEEVVARPRDDYKKVLRKWNRVYAINYETLFNTYLVGLAEKLERHPISNKSEALRAICCYRNGKYAKLLESLIPQVRNSIQHQDFMISPRRPEITFYDRNKPPLRLGMEEYGIVLSESIYLTLAFNIAYFDLRFGVINAVIEAIDIVDDFLRKHGLRLKEGGPLSLLEWASLIKTGKV